MNEVVIKGALKMIKNFISPDQMKQAATGLIKTAIEYKNSIILDKENGEVAATAIFYEVQGTVYFAMAILSEENKIVRFLNVQPLDQLINSLISKL